MANGEWRMANRKKRCCFVFYYSLFATHYSLLSRRFRRESRATHAHAPARVLPQLLARVQMAERARHGLKVVGRKPLGDVGVVKRLGADRLEDALRQRGDLILAPA